MIDGEITRYNCSPFFLDRKHQCLNCNNILEKRRREVVVNSASEEAKNYDFSLVDTYLNGNIKFITYYFGCQNCGKVYEIKELMELEKEQKRIQKQARKLEKQRKKLEKKQKRK